MEVIKKHYLLAVLVLLLLPSIWYLFLDGFIKTDDGGWMIIRFSAFYQALTDGQVPARFLSRLNFGYGYPVANFLYPGFMYFATPLHVLGLSFVSSIKAVIGLSMIFSGVFTFLWLRKLFDDWSSFFAGLYYVYAPYHLFDITKRGSVGEILSLAVFPFVLWQIEKKSILWVAIGIALLLISHNTLAILFLVTLLLYMSLDCYLSVKNRKKNLRFYALTSILGLGISSFFFIPAVLELSNTVFFKTQVSVANQHFADYNLIGITSFIILVVTFVLFLVRRNLFKKHRLTVGALVITVMSIFLSSSASSFLWDILPVAFIQFPFRMLSLAIIASSLIFAFVLSQLPNKFRSWAGIVIVAATVVLSKDYLMPKSFSNFPDSYYSTNEATTTVADEYMPLWVKEKPQSHFDKKVEVVRGEGEIINVSYNSNNVMFDYSSDSPSVIRVSTIYYPGWKAYSNGGGKAIFYDNDQGLMEIKLASGNQKVRLFFGETPLRTISDLVSLSSFIALAVFLTRKNYKNIIAKIP